MRPWLRRAWICAFFLVAAVASVESTAIAAGVESSMEVLDADGNPESRAGAHPDLMILKYKFDIGEEETRDAVFELPPGMTGNPSAVELCPAARIERADFNVNNKCPAASQVGEMSGSSSLDPDRVPIYLVEPAPGQAVKFAAPGLFGPSVLAGQLRPDDLGLTLGSFGAPQNAKVLGEDLFPGLFEDEVVLWGIPADHQEGSDLPRRPLFTLPTRCDGLALPTTVRVRTWQHQDRWLSNSSDAGRRLVGCDELGFQPRLDFDLSNAVADESSGVTIDVAVPQDDRPDSRATAQVRDLRLLMPEGMSIAAGGVANRYACADAQFGLGTGAAPSCPPSSRIGSAEINVTALGEAATGAIYLGEERPGDRFRLLIAIRAGGTEMKLVGSMRPEPGGRLVATINDLPQVSFGHFTLRLDGGPRALFANSLACGSATADASFATADGRPPVLSSDTVVVAARPGHRCGEALPFDPSLQIASSAGRGGRPTSISTIIGRNDGEQAADRFEVLLPPGFSANLGSVDRCPSAALAAKMCPAASRLGSAFATVGPGADPAELRGAVYFTGPYRRAPFGLSIVFDAAIGPFHLGSLDIRAAMRLNSDTGQVSIETASLPGSFEGMPMRFQTIGFDIDRPGFLHTPTSCRPQIVRATIISIGGAVAQPRGELSSRGCIDLPFKPRISLALSGRSQLHRDGKPGLRIAMQGRSGDANVRALDLMLPRALAFDSRRLQELCARRLALKNRCPAGARVGTGSAQTAVLEAPLKGPVYAVQPKGNGQPDLWADLEGEGIRLTMKGQFSIQRDRVVTNFQDLPDIPLAAFEMKLKGGEGGIVVLAHDPCGHGRRKPVASGSLEGQNAAYREARIRVATPGCPAG